VMILDVHASIGDLQRLARDDQRQQRENMSQTPGTTLLQEVVERRIARVGLEQALTFPDGPGSLYLLQNDTLNEVAVDRDTRVLSDDGRERSPGLPAHVEARIVERREQAVRGALGYANGEHPRNAPAHIDLVRRIEQGIGQLPDMLLGNLAERKHRVVAE